MLNGACLVEPPRTAPEAGGFDTGTAPRTAPEAGGFDAGTGPRATFDEPTARLFALSFSILTWFALREALLDSVVGMELTLPTLGTLGREDCLLVGTDFK